MILRSFLILNPFKFVFSVLMVNKLSSLVTKFSFSKSFSFLITLALGTPVSSETVVGFKPFALIMYNL